MTEYAITFAPSGRTVHVLAGTPVLEATALAGLAVQTPCGGRGTCGKCRVRFVSGPPAPTATERKKLAAGELAEGWRLACQHLLAGPTRLHVPAESVYGTAEQILTAHRRAKMELRPAVRRKFVRLNGPTLADPRDDLARLRDGLGMPSLQLPAAMLRRLPGTLRESDWAVTVMLADDQLIDITPGRGDGPLCGAAFDIGTTTVVGTLMDLADGGELAVTARINPQVAFGDDVLSRILLCREQPDGLDRLHRAVLDAVTGMLEELAADASIRVADICELSVAGNTTMQLLFAGVWPGPLGTIPFAPAFRDPMTLSAEEMHLPIHAGGRVYVFPAIGGFLGGDTVAGVLATDLASRKGNWLLVDIGTNGEVVVARDGRMWGASTAAGPAFEGARISMGMRAAPGAIEKVIIADRVEVNVIGDIPPVGLCGTALIDAAAGLLERGMLDSTGRLAPATEQAPGTPGVLRDRIRGAGAETMFVLADGDGDRPPVVLTQRDIRELQLASGAIRAGIAILLERAGLTADRLDGIFLAGAFGNFIRRENALRIGLLPAVPIERIHFVGNASSMGAKLALLSVAVRDQAEALARQIRRVDLSADPNFQEQFAEAMVFPGRCDPPRPHRRPAKARKRQANSARTK